MECKILDYKISDVLDEIHRLAPPETALAWDNCGLLIGSKDTVVTKILVALDVTPEVISEAKNIGANLIVSHHPVIFPSIKSIATDSVVYSLIKSDLSVISAHTNLDVSDIGINKTLADLLGLSSIEPLDTAQYKGLIRIGDLAGAVSASDLISLLKSKLNADGIRYTPTTKPITKLAVAGGACAELWSEVYDAGANAFITAEVKHHQFLEAKAKDFMLIDAGHFSTEHLGMKPLCRLLSERFEGIAVEFSTAETNPVTFA